MGDNTMNSISRWTGWVAITCLLLAVTALAAPFEPLFQIVSIEGECLVQPVGESNFSPAEPNKAYAYGSVVKTGRRSTAVIRFSEGNECRVLANAHLAILEDTTNQKLKTIKLTEGEVEVTLDEKFHETNDLNVQTATAICGAIGCKFNVRAGVREDMHAVVIICRDGKIKINGVDFNIPIMENDDGVSVVGNLDLSYIKIRNIMGDFNIHVFDANKNEKIIEAKKDCEIKIWRKMAQDGKTIIITIVILGPDGSATENFTFTQALGEGDPTPDPDPEAEGENGEDGSYLPPTPTTTVTTTTTTIPLEDAENAGDGGDTTGNGTTTTTTQPDEDDDDGGDAPTPTPVGNP
ncbi:MAG: hypothetical protein A2498_14070 [Lentisphaerae bacterium RIFOXYC12_FULL_60_16]|nr:MAG: hypothetical protein A2498_14070 [Lentisphaerae bacterium RIFOXYC12_FULL_60_16]OGV69503.1 MAG: hypothetical protein A2269_05290 [Lentisphaerae bacterium RIFOXYA12_FULL_60_10]OGV86615.1 MAG: hypothetical protein A2340_03005 [Lentisphaerae bacterium RIFOXYB12_FULL_60_10]